MLVKDIAAQAAFLLGKQEVSDYLKGDSDVTPEYTEQEEKALVKEANTLLRCYNIVENEIALDYLPLTAEETVTSSTGALPYSSFLHTPVTILSVTDEYGNKLPFTIFPEYVKTHKGTAVITYAYSPRTKAMEDGSEYGARVPERLLSYGVACEYCLVSGLYDEALLWDKKYKDALLCAHSASRPHVIRSRRWV